MRREEKSRGCGRVGSHRMGSQCRAEQSYAHHIVEDEDEEEIGAERDAEQQEVFARLTRAQPEQPVAQ